MLRTVALALSLVVVLLPGATVAGGGPANAGKGWIEFGSLADSPDQAFVRDYVERDELYDEFQRDSPWNVEDMGVGYHDLNDDGVPELFVVYPEISPYCEGTAGCEGLAFQMRDGHWELLVHQGYAWVSDEKVKGYRTFYTGAGLVTTSKWEWDGTEYRYSCVESMPTESGSNIKTRCD